MKTFQVGRVWLMLVVVLAVAAVAGCGGASPDAVGPAPGPTEPFYETLQRDALSFEFRDGEWLEDFGDAAAFGPPFYLHAGLEAGRQDYLAMARAAGAYNLSAVEKAGGNIFWYLENLEEVFMAMLGMVEYAGVSGDTSSIPALDRLIRTTDGAVRLLGDYVNVSVGEFAADLYGPTAITGGIVLIYLQYATYLDTSLREERIDRGAAVVARIDEQAWSGGYYRFRPGEDKLFLYPNAIMMTALCRLYELTGEDRYLERAEAVYRGIQPLRFPEMGFYRSPYSQEYQGALTDEYATLSSQNYLTMGLMLLYRNTKDPAYLDEALWILDHIRCRLYDPAEGKLLHHWIDGRIACLEDPDYFCSGCNLQTLYILRYLQEELDVPLPW